MCVIPPSDVYLLQLYSRCCYFLHGVSLQLMLFVVKTPAKKICSRMFCQQTDTVTSVTGNINTFLITCLRFMEYMLDNPYDIKPCITVSL